MSDPVLRVLNSRQNLIDEGYSKSLMLSGAAHATTFFALLILTLLTPKKPLINVVMGFAVPLPKGGGIMKASEKAPTAEEAAPVPPKEAPKAEVAAPAPVKLIKPETATIKKGIAPVDLKKSVKEPKKQESREIALDRESMAAKPAKAAAVRTPGAATTNSGFDLTAQSPGVSDGSDSVSGPMAFYLAAAKNKIWANWLRQIRPDFSGIATVTFTIHRDGSIDEVQVIESSGSQTIDRLAERAVISTQLSPMPNSFEKDSLVIHANFKPVS